MRRLVVLAVMVCLAAAVQPALSDTIVVDGGGGGDYLTIQEGVDAALNYDTVLVAPGLYADVHVFELNGWDRRMNVFFEKGITLMSIEGPEVTIVDGGGVTDYGILGMPDPDWPTPWIDPPPVVIEGFTVRNGGSYFWSKGIVAEEGEARGNIVSDYDFGIASGISYDYTGIPDDGRARSGVALIEGNTCEDNYYGIGVVPRDAGLSSAVVRDNTAAGNTVGVSVRGPDTYALVVGNEISENSYGVSATVGGSTDNGTIDVEIYQNTITNNTAENVHLSVEWSWYGQWLNVTLGGSLENANDIYGAPVNLSLRNVYSQEPFYVDASYNYWGSILCDEFEPLFYLYNIPDTCFTYFPFTDEPHVAVYDTCESVVTEHTSWGAIKALYR